MEGGGGGGGGCRAWDQQESLFLPPLFHLLGVCVCLTVCVCVCVRECVCVHARACEEVSVNVQVSVCNHIVGGCV